MFPELRDYCAANGISLVDVDLRWGIPADSATIETIATCMSEIDRATKDAGGQPFFIVLLGERYGWIPTEADLNADMISRYDWVPNCSITHMEIIRGVLRRRNNNAAIFIRDPTFAATVPGEYRDRMIDSNLFRELHLQELESRLRSRFPNQCFDYSAQYDCCQDGRVLLKVS